MMSPVVFFWGFCNGSVGIVHLADLLMCTALQYFIVCLFALLEKLAA